MVYNPTDSVEISIEPGTQVEAVIVGIEDGKLKDLYSNAKKKIESISDAIKCHMEYKHQGKFFKAEQIFAYETNEKGQIVYSKKSKLGKFKKFYGSLPTTQQRVKLSADADGNFRLLMA